MKLHAHLDEEISKKPTSLLPYQHTDASASSCIVSSAHKCVCLTGKNLIHKPELRLSFLSEAFHKCLSKKQCCFQLIKV